MNGSYEIGTYFSLFVCKCYPEVWHGSENGHQGLNCVTEDHRSILFEVFRREATLVDNPEKEEQAIIVIVKQVNPPNAHPQ